MVSVAFWGRRVGVALSCLMSYHGVSDSAVMFEMVS